MNEIMLSICVPTYNHEKYISQALDSILMQQTDYSYEVLVGEDASPDGTRSILKGYEKKYPGKFQMFYRKENMRNEDIGNVTDLKLRSQGKYIITLEGDDFWTDPLKIDKQISFLEGHPEYIAVAHNCTVVDGDSKETEETYPECLDEIYTWKHYGSDILAGQTATLMYRNIFKDSHIDTSLVLMRMLPGDRKLHFTLLSYGKIFCIQEKMSAYRHIKSGGSSYSARVKFDYKYFKHYDEELISYAKKIKNDEGIKYAELIYMKLVIGSRKTVENSMHNILGELRQEKFSLIRYLQYLKQVINRKVLHKSVWA